MKETIKQVIEEHMALCFEDTAMALELICESLYHNHNIDAKHHGRSIYIGEKRVASIRTCVEPCEDAKIVGIWKYWIF